MGYSKYNNANAPRWDDYRAFEAIAKNSSIKRAASTLGTTQSALSKKLVRLERSLGVRLVDRGPMGAVLTFHGKRVFAHVLAAEKELLRAESDTRAEIELIEHDCHNGTSN